MRITLIGAGNVAWSMAANAVMAGHELSGVWSRDPAHAGQLAEAIANPTARQPMGASDAKGYEMRHGNNESHSFFYGMRSFFYKVRPSFYRMHTSQQKSGISKKGNALGKNSNALGESPDAFRSHPDKPWPTSANICHSLADIDRSADIYLICVADDALESVVSQLPQDLRGTVVHTSGIKGLDILTRRFAHCGVVYPIQTFTRGRTVSLGNTTLLTEANSTDSAVSVNAFARSLSSDVRPLGSDQRRQLHLAAVFACNFSNHMYTLSDELLRPIGLDYTILLPLIDETVGKLHAMPPAKGQSGPAARRDAKAVESEERLMEGNAELLSIYQTLSNSIMQRHNPQPTPSL